MASQHGTEWFAEVAARWDDMPMAVANNVNILKSITRHLGYDFDWSSASVLEVGSGTGLLSLEMAPRVKHVLAIDPSEAMMAQLIAKKEKRAINNLTTITAALDDIAQLEGRIFDIVVVAMTLHHIEHLNPILTIFAQSLAPKGRLFVYDFLREAGSDQFHGSDDTFDHEAAGVHHRAGFNEEDLAGLFGQAGLELEYAKHKRLSINDIRTGTATVNLAKWRPSSVLLRVSVNNNYWDAPH
eukprot:TRINITY_DN11828_c0_g1_i8.p2 TRINITY_DN11828_c0_g1~~TRINITY_DN11828_c0_g1_i8.p2  ORF type:complete len:241 (+),score=53.87 TRINITY_DN11828_c0_g1_i8:2233-2955(+)